MNRHERRKQRALERMRKHPAYREGEAAARSGKMPPAYYELVETAARLVVQWVNEQPTRPDLRWVKQKNDGVMVIAALPDVHHMLADSDDARRLLTWLDDQTGRQLTLHQTIWALRRCRAIPMPDGTYYGTEVKHESLGLQQLIAFAEGTATSTRLEQRSPCPHCGKMLDAASSKSGAVPELGMFTCCLACGGLARFGAGLVLELVTDEDLAALEPDHRAMLEDMSALVRSGRARDAMQGKGATREVPEA